MTVRGVVGPRVGARVTAVERRMLQPGHLRVVRHFVRSISRRLHHLPDRCPVTPAPTEPI